MRYLIFSDTHLTPWFRQDKFEALAEAIQGADRVIINGDFWESYGHSFSSFLESKWSSTLFPLLLEKKAIYLLGNHDPEQSIDQRCKRFCVEQKMVHEFGSGGKRFRVEHGNAVVPFFDERWGIRLPSPIVLLLQLVEGLVHVASRGKIAERLFAHNNKTAKSWVKHNLPKNTYLVTGHTHGAEVDLENRYINSGFSRHGTCEYVYIEDGKVTPVRKRY